ncbi:hypothetical protein BCR42DRAFT_413299, partial [Absidia repens]
MHITFISIRSPVVSSIPYHTSMYHQTCHFFYISIAVFPCSIFYLSTNQNHTCLCMKWRLGLEIPLFPHKLKKKLRSRHRLLLLFVIIVANGWNIYNSI